MKVPPTLCENFSVMSKGFYQQYKEATVYLRGLKCKTWDFLIHSEEENRKYIEAFSLRLNAAFAAIVFQALAVEAFVNLYGAQKIGEEKFYTEYEIKGATTESKLKEICKNYLRKKYPTSTKQYNRLNSLLKKRDRIVHSKPKEIDMHSESNNYYEMFDQYEFVYKDIDDEMNSYETVKKVLQELEGSQYDLIEEIQRLLMGELYENISEIHKIAFTDN